MVIVPSVPRVETHWELHARCKKKSVNRCKPLVLVKKKKNSQLCPDNVEKHRPCQQTICRTKRTAAFCFHKWLVKVMPHVCFLLPFSFSPHRQCYWLWALSIEYVYVCVAVFVLLCVLAAVNALLVETSLKITWKKNHSVIHSLTHPISCVLIAT